MRLSATFVALSLPFLSLAVPVKRASANDLLVLQFANVLEQLETAFYTQALQKFTANDFANAGFSSGELALEQIQAIQEDECTHTSVLQSTITSFGATPLTTCQFDFTSALTDVSTMAAVARVVENVGVSAYLGAASLVVDNPEILTAAASIVTIEARHQTMLNVLAGAGSIPQAFDIPLSPSQILAIAGAFISGCDLGVPANTPLTVTSSGTPAIGSTLTFNFNGLQALDPTTLSCQMLTGGVPFAISLPFNQCVVPQGINGPVYLFVTNSTQPLLSDLQQQFAASIVAGPTLAFIDSIPQSLGQLVRTGTALSGTPVDSSATLSPDQASTVAASAATSSPGVQAVGGTAQASPVGPSPDGAVQVLGWSNASPSTSTTTTA